MKKIILSIIACILLIGLASCDREREPHYESSDLDYLLLSKSEEKQKYLSSEEYNNFKLLVRNFSTDLSESIYRSYHEEYDKLAVSPLSIYMALAMGTASASDEARAELTQMLGIPYSDILEYTKYLYSQLNQAYYDDNNKLTYLIELSNSIWLNESLSYKQEGVELLKNSFYTDSYKVPFSSRNEQANKAVQDYVCRNTRGLINNTYNFSPLTLFLLINTLYLKDVWNMNGQNLKITTNTYKFNNVNNSTIDICLLIGNYFPGQAQNEDGFEYFYTSTSHDVRLYFIKPTTKSLDQVYTKENLDLILSNKDYDRINEELKEEYFTRCLFPCFEATFNKDLVSLLKDKYGIIQIFDFEKANFDKITDENCYTSQLIHQTKLIVDQDGIEGAAVTIMANSGSSAPEEIYKKVYKDFIVDQGFGYIIVKNDVVLFSGVVKNI